MRGVWNNSPFIILVVVDGIRLSDTGKHFENIPWQQQMAQTNRARLMCIKNSGTTLTVPGHIALSSGVHGDYANDGSEFNEERPSFVNLLSQERNTYGAVICSKGKLSNPLMPFVRHQDNIVVNCGPGGNSKENRRDETTVWHVIREIDLHYSQRRKRTTCIVNLHEPDTNAHMGNIDGYRKSIGQSDKLVSKIYNALNKYNKNFVLMVTNDHGRHTFDVTSHGCGCEGCRNIYLFVYGPKVKNGLYPEQTSYNQINVFNTLIKATTLNSSMDSNLSGNIVDMF